MTKQFIYIRPPFHVSSAIGAILFCISVSCGAQAPLSLADAVNQALRSRPRLQAEAERIAVAEGLSRQARLIANPEFQFQNENLRPGQTYSRDVDTLALINQPLDILGKRKQRLAVAGETVSQAQADYQVARWQLVRSVKSAYWAARGSQETRDSLRNSVENFQRIVTFHSAQLTAGAIPEQDFLRVRLEAERMKLSADLAALDATEALVALLKEIGRTSFAAVTLTEPLEPVAIVIPLPLEQALAQRADVQAARAALGHAVANARLQEVVARPDLNVTYGFKRTELPDALTGVNTVLGSLRVTLPLTDRNQGNRAAAAAEVRRQQQLVAAAEAEARADYYAAVQEFTFRRDEFVNTLEPLREHAAEISRIAAAAYAEGGTDLLRLLDAERVRLEAELARTRGLVEYRQSLARLEAAEGVDQ